MSNSMHKQDHDTPEHRGALPLAHLDVSSIGRAVTDEVAPFARRNANGNSTTGKGLVVGAHRVAMLAHNLKPQQLNLSESAFH
jgi:hypothetical protein